jgi:DNA topoisomerase-1
VELEGLDAEVRIGQFGPYVARSQNGDRLTAGLPADLPPADLSPELVAQLLSQKSDGPQQIGKDPNTGQPVLLKVGPYGPYVQLGADEETAGKPKRASLLKGMSPNEMTLDVALQLLSLPRLLGEHPETGKPVQAGVGRYGPYVLHDGRYVSLKRDDNVLEIDLARALDVLAAAPERAARGGAVLRELGAHPDGGPVQILSGRYGPYVKYGKVNATLPKGTEPDTVTLEQAVQWIAEKAASGKTGKSAAKKSAAKQGTANKGRTGTAQSGKKSSSTKATAAPKKTPKKPAAG